MTEKDPSIKEIIRIPLLFVVVMWIVFSLDVVFDLNLSRFGIFPRNFSSLPGIIFTPFLHGDWGHLFNNSIPILALGMGVYYFYKDVANRIMLYSVLITGLWMWSFARPSFHIGASGLVYALASFVFVSGMIKRNMRLLALSLLVVFEYGGMIWGVLPIQEGVSWEGHLLGGLTGMMLAIYYRKYGMQPTKFDWEDEEDDEGDEDDDQYWKNPDQNGSIRYYYRENSSG